MTPVLKKFGGHRLALTQGFRFAEQVAAEANEWLVHHQSRPGAVHLLA